MVFNIFLAVGILILLFLLNDFIRSFPAMIAVGPIPSSKKGIDMALELAKIKKGEVFYDLGSGNGKVLIEAVKKYDCRGVGYELVYPVMLLAKLRAKIAGVGEKIEFRCKNLFDSDLENADVIYCFLTPELMEKIGEYIKQKKLKNGARIISYAFSMKNYHAEKKIDHTKHSWNIYLYKP